MTCLRDGLLERNESSEKSHKFRDSAGAGDGLEGRELPGAIAFGGVGALLALMEVIREGQ